MPNYVSPKVGFLAKAPGIINEIIHLHSTIIGLTITVAWLIRCKSFLYTTKISKIEAQFDTSKLTVDEVQRAEIVFIKYFQAKEFTSVISNLSNNFPLKKSLLPVSCSNLAQFLLMVFFASKVDWQMRQLATTLNTLSFYSILLTLKHF